MSDEQDQFGGVLVQDHPTQDEFGGVAIQEAPRVPFQNRTRPTKDEIRAEIEAKSAPSPGPIQTALLGGLGWTGEHVVAPLASLPYAAANMLPIAMQGLGKVNELTGGGKSAPTPLFYPNLPSINEPHPQLDPYWKPTFTVEVPPNANINPSWRPYAEAGAEVATGLIEPANLIMTPVAGTEVLGQKALLGKAFTSTIVGSLVPEGVATYDTMLDKDATSDDKKKAAARFALTGLMAGGGMYATTRGEGPALEPRDAAMLAKEMNPVTTFSDRDQIGGRVPPERQLPGPRGQYQVTPQGHTVDIEQLSPKELTEFQRTAQGESRQTESGQQRVVNTVSAGLETGKPSPEQINEIIGVGRPKVPAKTAAETIFREEWEKQAQQRWASGSDEYGPQGALSDRQALRLTNFGLYLEKATTDELVRLKSSLKWVQPQYPYDMKFMQMLNDRLNVLGEQKQKLLTYPQEGAQNDSLMREGEVQGNVTRQVEEPQQAGESQAGGEKTSTGGVFQAQGEVGETPQQRQIREYREARKRETGSEAGSVRTDYDLYNSLVDKLRALPNTLESFAAKSEIGKQIEDLKNKYGGMPPPKTPPLQTFGTTTEDRLRNEDAPFGMQVAKDNTVPTQGLVQRIKAQAGQGEWSMLQDAGVEQFLAGKQRVNVGELTKWVEENGPRVEVRKFGKPNLETSPEVQRVVSQRAQLIHEMDTKFPGWQVHDAGNVVSPDNKLMSPTQAMKPEPEGRSMPKELFDLANKKWDLDQQLYTVKHDLNTDKSHWSSIAPKAESEMPGYVEIAVVKPPKLSRRYPDMKEDKQMMEHHQFPSTHSFPPNTLGWVRGYIETAPDGRKVFRIIEVQSDWAAQVKEKAPEGQGYEGFSNKTAKDPRLEHYESLALKAAIDHAVKEGADAIAVDDAQTVMLTEGHDKGIANARHAVRTINSIEKDDYNTVASYLDDLKNEFSRHGAKFKVDPTGEKIIMTKEPFVLGMTQHYEKSSPDILRKLTGEAGQKMEFGEHKMAFEQAHDEGFSSQPDDFERPREDLIFKNPDGTPKTTSTASVFGLEGFKRQAEGRQMSQFGRTFTEDVSRGQKGETIPLKPGEKGEPRGPGALGITPQPPQWAQDVATAVGRMVKEGVEGTAEVARKIGNHLNTNDLREGITKARDVADNQATLWGRRSARQIENLVDSQFDKGERDMAKQALTFVRETDSGKSLQDMKATLNTSTKADKTWKQRALNAIDFAEKNLAKLQKAAEAYKQLTDFQIDREHQAGYETPSRKGYVFHAQDVNDMPDFFEGGKAGSESSFKAQRVHDTYADSIAAGVDPKTLNSTKLLEARLSRGQKLVNLSSWVDSMKTLVDPVTKQKLVDKVGIVKRPDGTQYVNVPKGYVRETLGNQIVAVHKGYDGLISALTDPSWFDKSVAGRTVQKANATSKAIALAIDTFHAGRVAIWDSLIKTLGITTFKLPIPSYRKGITLLDMNEADIRQAVKEGRLGKGMLTDLTEKKRVLNLLVSEGFNVGRITDSLHQEWIQGIQGIGTFNKWLFDQFQRGVMSEIGLLEFERQKGMYKNLSENEVARKVAKEVNTRFGNIGRQGWFKSRTMQDTARLLALAPQWNEGLVRSEWGALRDIGQTTYDAATGKRFAMGLLGRSVIGMVVGQFIANQLLNYYTRGHPTWENKEEGLGAKLSAWVPDVAGKGPGFFLNPLGLGAEITHLIMTKFEKTGNMTDTLNQVMRSRSSQAMKPVLDFVTKEDFLGRPIKEGEMLKTMGKDMVPAPIGARAIGMGIEQLVTGKQKQEFPGQIQRQVMSSVGIKTDLAPSPESRMFSLAHAYRDRLGVPNEQKGFESDYKGLTTAVRLGNEEEARKQVETLLQTKPIGTLLDYYRSSYPKQEFTGSKRTEAGFVNTLNPEQLGIYQKMREERFGISEKALALIMKVWSEKESTSAGSLQLQQTQQRLRGVQ